MINFITVIFTRIAHLFSPTQAGAVNFFSSIISDIEQFGSEALTIIAQGVLMAEETTESGAQKLATAKAYIVPALETAGITASENVINGGIEAAVAKLNALQASSLPAPSATLVATPAPTLISTPAPTSAPATAITAASLLS